MGMLTGLEKKKQKYTFNTGRQHNTQKMFFYKYTQVYYKLYSFIRCSVNYHDFKQRPKCKVYLNTPCPNVTKQILSYQKSQHFFNHGKNAERSRKGDTRYCTIGVPVVLLYSTGTKSQLAAAEYNMADLRHFQIWYCHILVYPQKNIRERE